MIFVIFQILFITFTLSEPQLSSRKHAHMIFFSNINTACLVFNQSEQKNKKNAIVREMRFCLRLHPPRMHFTGGSYKSDGGKKNYDHTEA